MNELTTTQNANRMSDYAMTIADVQNQVQLIQQVLKSVMKDGEHYGTVPGCGNKKVLLKSGAEKLAVTFRLAPEYIINKTELGAGHREYEIICKMVHIPTGQVIGQGVGSCSTMESKYRWRTGEKVCPECEAKTIIKGKKEYGGGWVCLASKGGCGKKFKDGDKAIESQTSKAENPDIADVYNTVLKMGKKRAQVDATLTCTGASDIFEQDLDEFSEEELRRVREEREEGDGGKKPHTDPPKSKSQKLFEEYAAEIVAIDTVSGLNDWYKTRLIARNKILSSVDQKEILVLCAKHKAELSIDKTADEVSVSCPDRDGDKVYTAYCDSDCTKREGCPSHA